MNNAIALSFSVDDVELVPASLEKTRGEDEFWETTSECKCAPTHSPLR